MTQLPHNTSIDYSALRHALQTASPGSNLHQAIVDAPFAYRLEATFLFLGLIVLLLADQSSNTITCVTLSRTELADGTRRISSKRFEDIAIPLDHPVNIVAKAIQTGEPQSTSDWQYLFTPVLKPEEARLNQAAGAISFSTAYPLTAGTGGAIIFNFYQYPENMEAMQREFMRTYATIVNECLLQANARAR